MGFTQWHTCINGLRGLVGTCEAPLAIGLVEAVADTSPSGAVEHVEHLFSLGSDHRKLAIYANALSHGSGV